MKYIGCFFLMAILSVSLTACVTSHSVLCVNIASANYLNPDVYGKASPVVISIYQLKSPFKFDNANFGSLENNSAAVLGTNLIDKQTLEVRPGKSKILNLNLIKSTKYIGVVAGYRKINQARWHSIITVPNNNKDVSIKINLESEGLRILKVK